MFVYKEKKKHFSKNSFVSLCLGAILTILMDSRWSEELFPDLSIFPKGPSSLSPVTLITLCTYFQSLSDYL